MQIRHRATGAALALIVLLLVSVTGMRTVGRDTTRHETLVETVTAKMRDGVELTADVYRPVDNGKYPVMLQRTPYDRRGFPEFWRDLASRGYVVILQDTRGRWGSAGEFYPFKYEAQDGYDSIEWAAGLPYSNGKVGMWGGSYVGATQMLAATAKPPHLVAIFPFVTASEYYEGWTYHGGVLQQWFASTWATVLAENTLTRLVAQREDPKKWVWKTPVEQYPMHDLPGAGSLAPYYKDWIAHERDDEYWKAWKVSDHYGEMTVKALHGTGWHDIFLKGAILNYLGMRDKAATPEARATQRLLIGPWAHAPITVDGKVGDVGFGESSFVNIENVAREWADFALKGERNQFATGAPVRLFIMGENVWRDEQEFPLARTKETRYYLHGDGALSTTMPGTEAAQHFVYDPENPVPTIGGRLCCGMQSQPGPYDQRPNEQRGDVLVFSTPPLERAVEATGFVSVELYASTSAADTDFTAMLVDVDPSGYARYLTDGIVRAKYRKSTTAPEPIEPGKIEKYRIDLWATGNLFKAGHRIRVYVSSSNFPRFNRNLNTGEPMLGSTRSVKAEQTIYHDAEHPSAVILPVIPR